MKTVGTWSIDTEVKAWIDQKIANKSQFVNRILRNAMVDEILSQEKRKQRPKCTKCSTPMRYLDDEWRCMHVHCRGVWMYTLKQIVFEICNNCSSRFWGLEPEPIHCMKCELFGLPITLEMWLEWLSWHPSIVHHVTRESTWYVHQRSVMMVPSF